MFAKLPQPEFSGNFREPEYNIFNDETLSSKRLNISIEVWEVKIYWIPEDCRKWRMFILDSKGFWEIWKAFYQISEDSKKTFN